MATVIRILAKTRHVRHIEGTFLDIHSEGVEVGEGGERWLLEKSSDLRRAWSANRTNARGSRERRSRVVSVLFRAFVAVGTNLANISMVTHIRIGFLTNIAYHPVCVYASARYATKCPNMAYIGKQSGMAVFGGHKRDVTILFTGNKKNETVQTQASQVSYYWVLSISQLNHPQALSQCTYIAKCSQAYSGVVTLVQLVQPNLRTLPQQRTRIAEYRHYGSIYLSASYL